MKELYKKHSVPPKDALKEIMAGRLRGKSDINPQWRIEALTDMFGLIGEGWYYKVRNKEFVSGANGTIAVFVDIELFYLIPELDRFSEPIHGSGGSMFVADEKSGLYTNDEAVKMAITDALGVACKHLGIASDVYRGFKINESKYEPRNQFATEPPMPPQPPSIPQGLPKGVKSMQEMVAPIVNAEKKAKEMVFCSQADLNIILSNIDNLEDNYKLAVNQRLAKYEGKIPKADADKVLLHLGLQ